MALTRPIAPCLWFADQAEEAARFYVDIFPNSRIRTITRYGTVGHEFHGRPAGSVMTVEFDLDGHPFTALNGGPTFTFTEAISLQVFAATQDELDHYWNRLVAGGTPQPCGWLKDRFGLSWQVVPTAMDHLFDDPSSPAYERTMTAMFGMQKLDIAALQRAFEGR